MRNIKFGVLIVALLSLCISCKDDESPSGGSFVVNEQKYGLSAAHTQYAGNESDYYGWYLSLSSKGLKFDKSIGEYTGKGERIEILMWSYGFKGKQLPEGLYVYPYVDAKNAISLGSVTIGYDSEGGYDEYYEDFSEVYAIVKKKDKTNYEIEFSFTLEDTQEEITGTYTGPLEMVQFAI